MYASDYDETLPPMKDAAEVKKALLPYVRSETIFVQPGTDEPYEPNLILSGKKIAHIEYPNQMIVFYEKTAATDGTRAAAFLDGHAKRVSAAEWERLKKLSKIP
jgi:hypothetical protein